MMTLFLSLRRNWVVYAIIAVAGIIQVLLVTRSLSFLLSTIIPDDSFYYFKIAQNIAHGLGSTFDGVEPTNGFHPLWLLLITPLFSFFGHISAIAPIRMALGLSVVFNVVTAFFVFGLVSHVTQSRFARAFSMLLWSLNPFLIFETINGLETSLALMLASGFMYAVVKIENRGTTCQYIWLGVLAGFMILARLDMAFYLGAFLLWLFVREWGNRVVVKHVLLMGGFATAIVIPWILWNLTQFGMLLTSASNALSMVTHELIRQDNGNSLLQLIKAVFYNLDGQIRILFLHTGATAFLLMLIGATIVLINQKMFVVPMRVRESTGIHALFAGFILLFVMNVGVRFVGRSWYFVSFGIFVSLLFALVSAKLMPRIRYEKTTAIILSLFVLFTFYVSWSKNLKNQYLGQQEMYAVALWTNDHLPSTAVVGSFNSGIEGYFSTRRIVNLDGLVNNSAYDAMRERKLWAYMQNAGLTNVIDFPIYITYRYRGFFGITDPLNRLVPITTISLGGHSRSSDGIHIYKMPVMP